MEGFVDLEEYPTSMSAAGKNAYYLEGCTEVGHRPSYCICLNKIIAYERDKTLRGMSCESQIANKTCAALKLRAEELKAGKALYFVNRDKLKTWQSEQTPPVFGAHSPFPQPKPAKAKPVQASLPPEPAKPAAPAHFLDVKQGSYADALNAALKPSEPHKVIDPKLPVETDNPRFTPEALAKVEAELKPAAPAPKPTEPPKVAIAGVGAGLSLLEMARARLAAQAK